MNLSASSTRFFAYFLYCQGAHRDLHSFPTRRSSDLEPPDVDAERGAAPAEQADGEGDIRIGVDRKSTRLNSSHMSISYAVFCLKKKTTFRERPVRSVHRT